jgi:hypothetical protein
MPAIFPSLAPGPYNPLRRLGDNIQTPRHRLTAELLKTKEAMGNANRSL